MTAPQLPDPLVPAEVDLRDFGFMPLDTVRLRDSDIATVATGDEFKAAVLLWCTAWHQIPASSIPNDERWLARHSGAGARWKKVKEEALRGFIECNDGRWYHPVVAEKAAEGWNSKLQQEHKRACDRQRKANKERDSRNEPALPMPDPAEPLSMRLIEGIPCWRAWNSSGTYSGNSSGNSNGADDDSDGSRGDGLRKSRLKGRDSEGTGTGKGQGEVKENPKASNAVTQPPVPTRAGEIALLLRRLAAERLKTVRVGAIDVVVNAWAEKGVSDEHIAAGFADAVQDRELKGDASAITPGFVDVFVAKILNPQQRGSRVNAAAPSLDWWTSPAGIFAKAESEGIEIAMRNTGDGEVRDHLVTLARLCAKLGDGSWFDRRNTTLVRIVDEIRAREAA